MTTPRGPAAATTWSSTIHSGLAARLRAVLAACLLLIPLLLLAILVWWSIVPVRGQLPAGQPPTGDGGNPVLEVPDGGVDGGRSVEVPGRDNARGPGQAGRRSGLGLVGSHEQPVDLDGKTFERIGDLRYRVTGRDAFGAVAVDAVEDLYGVRNPIAGVDFSGSTAGSPVDVLHECDGSMLYYIPLYRAGGYAGIVILQDRGDGMVSVELVRPTFMAYTDTENRRRDGNVLDGRSFPLVSMEAAREALAASGVDATAASYEGMIVACAGERPLADPTAPFHTFDVDGERVLVNAVDGQVLRAADLERVAQDTGLNVGGLD